MQKEPPFRGGDPIPRLIWVLAEGGRLFTEVVQTHSAAQLIYRRQNSVLPTSQKGPGVGGWKAGSAQNQLDWFYRAAQGLLHLHHAEKKRPKGWLGAVIKYTFLLFLHAYHNCLPPRVPQGSMSIHFYLSPTKTCALHFISQVSI